MRNKDHPLYSTWKCMRDRCNRKAAHNYKYYGGRGIKVCDRWGDFWLFVEDVGPRPEGYTLDRIDNDGDYTPENCRWASHQTQASNLRSNIKVEINGKTQTLKAWANATGFCYATLRARYHRGDRGQRLVRPPRKLKTGNIGYKYHG